MTLFCQTDEDGNLLVGPEKANGVAIVPASKLTIKAIHHFSPTEDHDGTVPLLVYLGESTKTAREHHTENYAFDREAGGNNAALTWLSALLSDGPRWVSSEIFPQAEIDQISKRRLRRAKEKINAKADRVDPTGPWFWRLPQHEGKTPDTAPQPVSDTWAPGASGGDLEETTYPHSAVKIP